MNRVDDIHRFLKNLGRFCHARTRILFILNKFKSTFSVKDIKNFLLVGDYEIVTVGSTLKNRYVIARPLFFKQKDLSVSVIVPVRNEIKNIESIVQRVPELGRQTEIVFVEGGSTDGTPEECQRVVEKYSKDRKIILHTQSRRGKGNAIKEAIEKSSGELMMILDADLVIPPEELGYFYHSFLEGRGEMLNATRLVYPLKKDAMPMLNRWGNRFFGILYSILLGQKLKDLFAGTKVFLKTDYIKIDELRSYFRHFDLWGDLDLLFGAAKLGLKIQDLPVHYYPRLHGESNMKRYRYAIFLCLMFVKTYRKLKPPSFL